VFVRRCFFSYIMLLQSIDPMPRKVVSPRQRISSKISNRRVNALLKSIKPSRKLSSKSLASKSLYDMYSKNAKRSKSPVNYRARLLVTTLADKMCSCERSGEGRPANRRPQSVVGACRRSVFQNRGLDFYTYKCNPKPTLKQKVGTIDPVVLRTFG
jgi:hypothetical protein